MIHQSLLNIVHDGNFPFYVAGFLFRNNSQGKKEVALIEKNHPEWQKGYWNGIGGKIETGEVPMMAMIREFVEATGVFIDYWRPFTYLQSDPNDKTFRWAVVFYTANMRLEIPDIISKTEEKVAWHPVRDIIEMKTIPNLRWIVPLALDQHRASGIMTEAT